MQPSWRAAAIVAALMLAPAIARADWLPAGNRIGDADGRDEQFVITRSGTDRVVVAWIHNYSEVRAQAWTTDGHVVEGWPAAGALLGSPSRENMSVSIAEDGAGGAFVAWVRSAQEIDLHLQHVKADGSPDSGWPVDGLILGGLTYQWRRAALAPDGAGGVLVGWFEDTGYRDYRSIVQRFDVAGAPSAGWPAGGFTIPNSAGPELAIDPAGHVFLGVSEYNPAAQAWTGMRLRRLDGNGAPDPGWPGDGTLVEDAKYASSQSLIPDGAGGVFANWYVAAVCAGGCGPSPAYYSLRVLGDGSPDDRWLPGRTAFSVAPDGAGGLLLGMVVDGRPGALRLEAGGAPAPGWAAEGNRAMSEVVYPWGVLVTSDGRGGAFVVWSDRRADRQRLYASRLDASGRLAPGWPATGSLIGPGSDYAYPFALVSLSEDAAIALWQVGTPYGSTGYLSELRPGEPGPIADLGPVDVEVGFGIVRAGPNPARGPFVATVELRNEGPARLDVIDVAGRVLESRDYSFESQARGVVRLNQDRTLRPGVYWLHLVQGTRVAKTKVIVLE